MAPPGKAYLQEHTTELLFYLQLCLLIRLRGWYGERLRMACKGAKTDKQNTYFKWLICNREGIYAGVSISATSLLSWLGFKKIKTKVIFFFCLVFMDLCCLQNDTLNGIAAIPPAQPVNRVSLSQAHRPVLRSFPQNVLRSTHQGAPRKTISSPSPNLPPSTSF